jgi:hypothetical protein
MTAKMKDYALYFEKKFMDYSFNNDGNLLEENIMLGETLDWGEIKERDCPRIEFFVQNKTGAGFNSNVDQDDHLVLMVAAYRWRDSRIHTRQDMLDMYDMMDEIETVVKSISADRANGRPVPDGFMNLAPFTNVELEPDFGENISSGLMSFTVVLTKINY